jgi:predicted RNA-binding protein Jag
MQEEVQKQVSAFFTGLGIVIEWIEVTFVENDINVRVQTPDSALLIGMHGKNIESFQHLLSRMLEKVAGYHVHLHLEVNDYMKSKDERLFRFLDTKIAFIMSSPNKTARIPNLTSYERKKAHGYISMKDIAWLKTKSDGEWAERALFLEYTWEIVKQEVKTVSPVTPSPSRVVAASHIDLSEDWIGI